MRLRDALRSPLIRSRMLNVILGVTVIILIWMNITMAATLNESILLLIESRQP